MSLIKKKKAEEPMDLDSVMKKYDRESNVRIWEGKPRIAVNVILAIFSVFCLYVTLFASWLEELRLTTFVAWIVFLGYLVFPARKTHQRVNHIPWYDILLMVVGTGAFLYYAFNAKAIIQQGSHFENYQIVIGIIGVLALAEVCRRSVGLPILIVAGCFLAYALTVGLSNPSLWGKLNYTIRYLFYGKEGVLSTPINVCSKFIVVFIVFGAFLERTGIADYFIQMSNGLVGRFSGGPAKVAVVASALEGVVSGSSVANTVGSGAVTIPLMKKAGYKPEFAGAAEAAASTGGQIMPPIMGAAAFLMADYVQLPYGQIALKAVLPALLYFTGIFISVHLEAKKVGLKGLPKEELPKLKPLLKKSYLLLPLVLLIYLVSTSQKSIQYAAALSIVACIVVTLFSRETRITPMRLLEALAAGGQGSITVAAACGIAGIIAGTITMTGLANVIINGIVVLAGDSVLIALFLTMICRTLATAMVHGMDACAEKGDFAGIERWQYAGILMQGVRIAIPAVLLCIIPAEAVTNALNAMPDWLSGGMAVGGGMVASVGYAMVINMMATKETWPFFILGFVLAAIPQLTLIALGLIGISLALIYLGLKDLAKQGGGMGGGSGDPLGDILNDYE